MGVMGITGMAGHPWGDSSSPTHVSPLVPLVPPACPGGCRGATPAPGSPKQHSTSRAGPTATSARHRGPVGQIQHPGGWGWTAGVKKVIIFF